MVGFILIGVIAFLVILSIGLSFLEAPDGFLIGSFMVAVVLSIVVAVSFSTITSANHEAKPEDRSPVMVVEKVDRQEGVYIFTMKDGTQVAKSSGEVVVSDTYGAEATIQYGNEYYSWGNFWSGDDWAGDEKVYYTPSNGG